MGKQQKTHIFGQKKKSKIKDFNLKKSTKNALSVNTDVENSSENIPPNNLLPKDELIALHSPLTKSLEDQKIFETQEKSSLSNNFVEKEIAESTVNNVEKNIERDVEILKSEKGEINDEFICKSSGNTSNLENIWFQERASLLSQISELQRALEIQEDQKYNFIEENEKKMKIILDEKQRLELQYRNLLSKLSSIKLGLEEKLKADSEDLASSKQTIERLEGKNQELLAEISYLKDELVNANNNSDEKFKEIVSLNKKIDKLEQEWVNEKDILYKQQYAAIENLEKHKKISRDWEGIALEERTCKNDYKARVEEFREKIKEFEDLLKKNNLLYDELHRENVKNTQIIDEYKEKISKIIENHKNDLKQMTDQFQSQIGIIQDKNVQLETRINELVFENKENKEEIERLLPFEKEVKEKNLLIGKLKHEAVILNEHLIKALKLLKKNNSEENIDKKLVTNLILSFITLPRNDTKRYEILQLMSSFLQWTDEQKVLAGLIRAKNLQSQSILSGLSFPLSSSFHDSLNFNYKFATDQDLFDKKSMSDLWIAFLQNETAVEKIK
ncbi:hypothetical protein PCK1_001553 [Pneumocystis canis]|nr:hypothetical protein PCK1_001553 [Pneumocystis canis]